MEEDLELYNKVSEVFADMEIQTNYYKEYEIHEVKSLTVSEFANEILNDSQLQREVDLYNEKNNTEWRIQDYLFLFDYALKGYVWSRVDNLNEILDHGIQKDKKYNFTIYHMKEGAPTLDEYRMMIYKKSMESHDEYYKKTLAKYSCLDENGEFISIGKWTAEDLFKAMAERKKSRKGIAGRPSNDKEIAKYDKEGNLIKVYKNRNECIKENELTKAGLSQHLKGKRKTLKGYIYKELTKD